jgi:hypothetical protein
VRPADEIARGMIGGVDIRFVERVHLSQWGRA